MNIYCFWTEDNELTPNRLACLKQLSEVSECNVVLVTNKNLKQYILPNHPLHEAYNYLSAVHKADYLRTYFMNFYGGGYSDIKKTTGSWIKSFTDLKYSKRWICGYRELKNGYVAYPSLIDKWGELVGNAAYICKPQTPLTKQWYAEMLTLLDNKLTNLIKNQAKHPRDCRETRSGYPIEWNEMLGRIFHKISYRYKNLLLKTLPTPIFHDYL